MIDVRENKTIKLLGCFLLSLIVIFSFLFWELELNHECEGVECEVCALIQLKKDSLYEYVTGVFLVVVIVQLVYSIFINSKETLYDNSITLVTLKVKLSN